MRNLLLAALAVLPLSGCNLVIPLEVEHDLDVDVAAGDFAILESVDLTGDEAWDERERIESIEVKRVEATILAVGAANGATAVDAVLKLRPEGAPASGEGDVQVAVMRDVTIAPGATTVATDTGALAGALMGALGGTGRFELLLEGTVDDTLDATVRISIAADVKVKAD